VTQKQFFQLLFDAGDSVCLASTPFGTDTLPIASVWESSAQYFCINALNGTRADANVSTHRTFLLEIDNMPLLAQDKAVEHLPISAKVFSGNKSFHYFITLAEPVSAEEYASLARRLQIAAPAIDKSCKNPSRLARTPFATRPESGKLQELLFLGHRVSTRYLQALLPQEQPEGPPRKSDKLWISSTIVHAILMPDEVMNEIHVDGRNNFFFWLGQRLLEAGFSKDERRDKIKKAYDNLRNKKDFSLREAYYAGRVK